MVEYAALAPVTKIRTSSSRIRVEVRLSASSFMVTVPTPEKAEPSRRMANSLKILRVDFVEAGIARGDGGEIAAGADHGARDLRPPRRGARRHRSSRA